MALLLTVLHQAASQTTTEASRATTLPAMVDIRLARTTQFTMGCGLLWQGTIFNHGTCPLITVHMFCAQKTSLDRSSRFVKMCHDQKSSILCSYVLRSTGTSFDCSICTLGSSCSGDTVLAGKYASVNVGVLLYVCFFQDGVGVAA